jgi:GNAT superfamily N-acetyltransferase
LIDVGTEIKLNKDDLYSFLLNTQQSRFDLWPNVAGKAVVDLLFNEISGFHASNIIKTFYNNELVAILVFDFLEWDTSHFGFKSACIKNLITKENAERNVIGQCLEKSLAFFKKHCDKTGIRFVSIDVASQDMIKSVALQDAGFKYILTWIDGMIKDLNNDIHLPKDSEVSEINSNEVEFFSKLAEEHYFKGGRFYLDSSFNKSRVNKMYGALVKSSFKNGEILLVYRVKEKPVGLFTCKKIATYKQFSDLKVAPLRFLIVDPKYRDREIGQGLFLKTIEYLSNKSDIITTGLEINNLPSLNLHTKLGFKFNYTHNVYHFWN